MLNRRSKWLILTQTMIFSALMFAGSANAQTIKERCDIAAPLKTRIFFGLGEVKGTIPVIAVTVGFIAAVALLVFAGHRYLRGQALGTILYICAAVLVIGAIPGIIIVLSGSKCI